MKIHKPSYDSAARLYTCELSNGFRLQVMKEEGLFKDLYDKQEVVASLLQPIIAGTAGWFTKPLTSDWLNPRIRLNIPTGDITEGFEGTIIYEAYRLVISKEEFVFHCKVLEMKEAEKVVIEFKEETPQTARRVLQKSDVLKARARAARALFKAEALTQEYIRLRGGEDTDWENEDEEEEGQVWL